MIVKFSRHAKRRAKLYNIPISVVENILKDFKVADGEHKIVRDVAGFKYPIKLL